jgi:hypothetical protein
MQHTFDVVDLKISEIEFFLQKMASCSFEIFEFNCYLSAYLASARTLTLALQQFKHIPGFDAWYAPHQSNLKANELSKFFLETRNSHLHGGPYPVSGGSVIQRKANFYFSKPDNGGDIPVLDVVDACRQNFLILLNIVFDCYDKLGVHIDPQQYYTKEHFLTLGKGIDHAECEIFGWVCSSLIDDGFDDDDRWHELRARIGECGINHLFYGYLGKSTRQPIVPEHFHDSEFSAEDRGWVHIPAGFASIEDYIKSIRNNGS